MAQLLGLEPGIQPPLVLVQEAEEQDEGRPQLVGERLDRRGNHLGHGLSRRLLAAQFLLALLTRVSGQVDILPADLGAVHAAFPMQLEQGPLALDVKKALQLASGEAAVRRLDERPRGFHQIAVARKPHRVPTPQSLRIEVRDLLEGVVLPSVRIAGQIPQRLQLADHRHRAGGPESVLELGEGGDSLVLEKLAQHGGRKRGLGHMV